ncbi:MAG: thiamine diphosphokinase [Thermoleophilia bacterium]|nr:thiamine diphosphokinase [Thermoleophilia bacterium]
MFAVIVAGAELSGPLDRELLSSADLLIAADSGADALSALSLTPHVLIGDLDSIAPLTRDALREAGVELIELQVSKDETDTEMALRLAVERGAGRITVLGGLGGPRLDHLLGLILLLTASWLDGVDVRLADDRHEVFSARGEALVVGRPGDLVSLLPLTPRVEGVRTEGLAYPLHGETLFQGATRGVSNELLGERARVIHDEGRLLIMRYRKDGKGR